MPSDSKNEHNSKLRSAGICIGLALLTLAVYAQVRHFDSIALDDGQYVTTNPYVQSGLSWSNFVWAFRTFYACNWHPLTWLSLMFDCQFFGPSPGVHHMVNVVLHIASTLLLFGALQQLTKRIWCSALVAGLFALHPLHVESVAWISERKDTLSAFFFMLTLWTYARYVQHKSSHSSLFTRHYSLSLLFFALGLMAKPMLVTLPFIFVLVDYWPLHRLSVFSWKEMRPLILEKIPFLLLALGSCVITYFAQKTGGAVSAISFTIRLVNAIQSYGDYAAKMLNPTHLAVYYPYPVIFSKSRFVAAILFLLAGSGAAIALRRRCPYWTVGWLWYLGTLVPVIGLVQVGAQSMADRYAYIPLIGLFIGLIWSFAELAKLHRFIQTTFALSGVVLLAACAWMTRQQVSYWKDNLTLFTHALAVAPPSAVAHSNLGVLLLDEHKYTEAKAHFEAGLQLYAGNPVDHANLGIILCEEGHIDEGIAHFVQAAKYAPNHSVTHNNWGVQLMRSGKMDEAQAHFRTALVGDPFDPAAHQNLAHLLMMKGQTNEAIAEWHEALRCRPNYDLAMNDLGNALIKQGRVEEATQLFTSPIKQNPGNAELHFNFGNFLRQAQKKPEAIAEYREAIRLKPGFTPAELQLANAYIQAGEIVSALAVARSAVESNPGSSDAQYQLAYLCSLQKNTKESIDHYHETIRLKPNWLSPLNNLAWLLATTTDTPYRNGPEAVALAEKAVNLTDKKGVNELDTLAAAQAEAGKFAQAVDTAQSALDLAQKSGQKETATQIQSRLTLYRSSQPYRE